MFHTDDIDLIEEDLDYADDEDLLAQFRAILGSFHRLIISSTAELALRPKDEEEAKIEVSSIAEVDPPTDTQAAQERGEEKIEVSTTAEIDPPTGTQTPTERPVTLNFYFVRFDVTWRELRISLGGLFLGLLLGLGIMRIF